MTNLIRSLASSLKWLVRPLGKGSEVRRHGNVVRLLVGSVMAERACNARGPSYLGTRGRGCRPPGFDPSCLCPKHWAPGGPNASLLSYTRFYSPSRLSLLLENPPFIGPNSLSLDNYISRDQYITSGTGLLVPSYIHFQH